MSDEMKGEGGGNTILEKIKAKEKAKKENAVSADKGRGEVLEALYSAEGESRATERRRGAEKAQCFSTSMRLTLSDLKRFNDAAFKVKTMRGKLTYDDVFALGLDYIERMSDSELEQFVMRKKQKG
ncbi:hypothetical protein R80B4_01102 [Fibrobacteres bacterium R8-0-B4]